MGKGTHRSSSASLGTPGRGHDLEVLGLLGGVVATLLAVILALPAAPGVP